MERTNFGDLRFRSRVPLHSRNLFVVGDEQPALSKRHAHLSTLGTGPCAVNVLSPTWTQVKMYKKWTPAVSPSPGPGAPFGQAGAFVAVASPSRSDKGLQRWGCMKALAPMGFHCFLSASLRSQSEMGFHLFPKHFSHFPTGS